MPMAGSPNGTSMMASDSPANLGYRWPAEWELHAATWVAWPHNRETWPGNFASIPEQFAALVRTIAEYEPVHVLAGGDTVMRQASSSVGDLPDVTLHDIPTNDAWCRDHGPTFLLGSSGETAIVDWIYNAWGGKYPPYDLDDAVPRQVAEYIRCPRFEPGIVVEGGAVEGNGCGNVLTTKSCLLNPNRNPEKSQASIEEIAKQHLGAEQILWLSTGTIAGDDTDGHIDQLARFVNPTTVALASEDDPGDENFDVLQSLHGELSDLTDQDGRPFDLVKLPMPQAKFLQGQRLPASYCNFYIANGVVIVPQFDDAADEVARATLKDLFPNRDIRGLPSLDISWGLGSFHCLTQQQPAWRS